MERFVAEREKMKHKIAVILARVLWWWMTGKWVGVSGFQVQEADPLLRPEEQMIARFSREIMAYGVPSREEILNGVARRAFAHPRHICRNPRKRNHNQTVIEE